ncbi:Brix domain-containing protein [Methanobacterium spitsbergense]|uniref:Probable Brix domain-containing ribosomal biogenesis protein n=1 Tax=Methanobacterium spitsbergense TaxID=2874285 RepID=A0A8T5UY35_9EURY|nr:ribosomal biogenesis protein [Methanobacterium spitsbergense]MBZ2165629.1 ribosomal biogenesis protein [Methanobacterium spitsbergense]
MLITTSRKPSQRTRSFCKGLVRVLNSSYINRGKMSIRDVLIKSSELGNNTIAVVSEMKGNPSRIDFQNETGEVIFSMDVTVGIPNSNASSKGRVQSEELKLRSEIPELNQLGNILDIPPFKEDSEIKNILFIRTGDEKNKAIIEFIGSNGMETGPKIFVKEWRT